MGRTDIVITIKTKSGQGHSDQKMVRDTRPSQDASTQQIWNSYLKEYRRYAPDMKRDKRTDSAITICLPKFLWGHKNRHNDLLDIRNLTLNKQDKSCDNSTVQNERRFWVLNQIFIMF